MGSLKHWLVAKGQKTVRRLCDPLVAPIIEELRRANLSSDDATTNSPLLVYGRRYFSQNDEDGILLEILRRIGRAEVGAFLEFGVGDGTENNTIILLAHGWRGAWIGGQQLAFDLPPGSRLAFRKEWITKDNAVAAAAETLASLQLPLANIRVASIDLDGNDGEIARALLKTGLAPDVFIVEYNAKFPPPLRFEMPYADNFAWNGTDYTGTALQSWIDILSDYRLVACNENGVNAFFVKKSLQAKFDDVPSDPATLYRRGYFHRYPSSGYPTDPRTVRYLARALGGPI
jgi:hypothetical protein